MEQLESELTKELKHDGRQGGSIGSLVGRLVGKIGPLVLKHAPKVLPGLALAGVSGAIPGATHTVKVLVVIRNRD